MTIDLDRRKRKLVDVFCCVKIKNDKIQPKLSSADVGSGDLLKDYENGELTRRHTDNNDNNSVGSDLSHSASPIIIGNGGVTVGNGGKHRIGNSVSSSEHQQKKLPPDSLRSRCGIQHWTLHRFVKDFYIPFLSKRRVKVSDFFLFFFLAVKYVF